MKSWRFSRHKSDLKLEDINSQREGMKYKVSVYIYRASGFGERGAEGVQWCSGVLGKEIENF